MRSREALCTVRTVPWRAGPRRLGGGGFLIRHGRSPIHASPRAVRAIASRGPGLQRFPVFPPSAVANSILILNLHHGPSPHHRCPRPRGSSLRLTSGRILRFSGSVSCVGTPCLFRSFVSRTHFQSAIPHLTSIAVPRSAVPRPFTFTICFSAQQTLLLRGSQPSAVFCHLFVPRTATLRQMSSENWIISRGHGHTEWRNTILRLQGRPRCHRGATPSPEPSSPAA